MATALKDPEYKYARKVRNRALAVWLICVVLTVFLIIRDVMT